tara:strand:- start:3119 stop:4126 length:1008 start_codon:yes stop_codon:yes gene_type:complete
MKNSLQKFMNGLIDYAGLFPPAKLPLDKAINEYISHLNQENKWMLGRFIIPISQLNDLEEFIPKFDNIGTLRLSVLGSQTSSDKEFLQQTKSEISVINEYRKKHAKKISIEVIETKLPSNSPSKKVMSDIVELLNSNNLEHYHEFPELPYVGINYSTDEDEGDWDSKINPTIEMISSLKNTGIKLRCGGIVKEAFPSVEQVAAMIQNCSIFQVPLKFTAGLHHPLRHHSNEYNTEMHGFINMFSASIFATNFPTPESKQEKFRMFILLSHMIDCQNDSDFEFLDEKLVWNVSDDRDSKFEITKETIEKSRSNSAISFGSCSFQEPIDDLTQLGWM